MRTTVIVGMPLLCLVASTGAAAQDAPDSDLGPEIEAKVVGEPGFHEAQETPRDTVKVVGAYREEGNTDCAPTTTPLVFHGRYEVNVCYETPEGDIGEGKGGIWASGESGLLWFFDRGNAEVLVKVLDGCAINDHWWVFVAPVTTLAFNLQVNGSDGRRWTHRNRQGVTATTRGDTAAFACADESSSAAVSGFELTPAGVRSAGPLDAGDDDGSVLSAEVQSSRSGCTPTTAALQFDGGYEVSMCYRTPDGEEGQAKSGIWASSESGLLWFFKRENAEVLVKVLNGCSDNGHRWVFVAPVTTLEFTLWVTGPNGGRWTHSNRQATTASTKADTRAFSCADESDDDPEPPPTDDSFDADHAALTAGLPQRPFVNLTVGGTEGSPATVGTLRLDLNPNVFPVIASQGERPSVLVAGSRLGEGRVVAFPGQDFLSRGDSATLLGSASGDRLLANAVLWAGAKGAAPVRVLADNPRIAQALEAQGIDGVEVVGRRGSSYASDWSTAALLDVDVAVVQTNEWGGVCLVEGSVAPLRAFAENGGGLVVAASALHWSWWIEQRHGPLTADVLLRDTGISWNEDSVDEIVSATTSVDWRLLPRVVWSEYIGGRSLGAVQAALLPGLFDSALKLGRTRELDLALARLVRGTPALPTSSAVPEARLAASVAETLGPHEWPETHPWAVEFPGLPAAGARRINGTVTVDASRSEFAAGAGRRERHFPLGFYAPPGALVTIEMPASHAAGALAVSVGELYDHLGEGRSAQPEWRRAPWLRREFPVVGWRTAVANAYGGSIALIVPADYSGTIPVTIRGAIPMAVYTADRSSTGEWFADLAAGAPQAIIQKMGGIRLVLSAEGARSITEPEEVAAFWGGFQQHHAELAGEPAPRAFESIWLFDPQVGWGYANAGRLRINYPLHGEHWVLAPGTAQGREYIANLPDVGPQPVVLPPSTGYSPYAHGINWWLFGHELGHQWQTEDWTGHGITEVGVNLFTTYTLNYYVYGGGDSDVYTEPWSPSCAPPLDHAALASRRWSTSGNCEKLALYRQLISEFGWNPLKRVFRSYYDPAYPRSTYGGALDGFAIRFSAIVQRDLVAFFRHWEYPLSDAAATTIRSFELEEWLPPGW